MKWNGLREEFCCFCFFRTCGGQTTLGELLVTNQVCPGKSKLGREKAGKWALNTLEGCPGEEGLLCFVGFQGLWAEAPRAQGSALPREGWLPWDGEDREEYREVRHGFGDSTFKVPFLGGKKCAKTDNSKAYPSKFYTKAIQSFPAVLGLLLAFSSSFFSRRVAHTCTYSHTDFFSYALELEL